MTEVPGHRMTIRRVNEPRFWRETEDADGHWIANGQPGPPVHVVVTPGGIRVSGDLAEVRPGVARWLALRLAEAAGVYEAVFGGDGSTPASGVRARLTPLKTSSLALSQQHGPKRWLCGCGKVSSNRGGMSVHEKTCPKAPAVLIEPHPSK